MEKYGSLLHKHNVARQIFIQKEDGAQQAYSNCRPITITTSIYKILEHTINYRMEKEDKYGRVIKNNKNQIGFSKGLGCELNLLKL